MTFVMYMTIVMYITFVMYMTFVMYLNEDLESTCYDFQQTGSKLEKCM